MRMFVCSDILDFWTFPSCIFPHRIKYFPEISLFLLLNFLFVSDCVLYSRFVLTGSMFSSFLLIRSHLERLHNHYLIFLIPLSPNRVLGDNIDLTNLDCPVFSAVLNYVYFKLAVVRLFVNQLCVFTSDWINCAVRCNIQISLSFCVRYCNSISVHNKGMCCLLLLFSYYRPSKCRQVRKQVTAEQDRR